MGDASSTTLDQPLLPCVPPLAIDIGSDKVNFEIFDVKNQLHVKDNTSVSDHAYHTQNFIY